MTRIGTTSNCATFPLSFSQSNIWALECAHPNTPINHISTTIRMQGRIDFVAMKKSLSCVLSSVPALRTRIALEDSVPVQYQVPFCEEDFPVFDFSQTSQEGILHWESAMVQEPMPFLNAPLYRFILFRSGERSGGIFMKVHHILSDGWSQTQLCDRIADAYLAILADGKASLNEPPAYQTHVLAEKKYADSPAYQSDSAFWAEMVQQLGEPSTIKIIKSASISPVGLRRSFQLPQVLNVTIQSFCHQNHISPFLVFYMALAVYFRRVSGSSRFTLGVPVYNRSGMTAKKTPGMFVSTLPFSSLVNDQWSFTEFAGRVGEQWLDLLRHSRFPYRAIQQLASDAAEEAGPLFHIALSYLNHSVFGVNDADVSFAGQWHYSGYQAEHLCLHLSSFEGMDRFTVHYDFLAQFFSEEEIESFHACLVNILRDALSAPDKPIHRLSLLSMEEREQVLYAFNTTEKPVPQGDPWAMLEDVVRQHPSRVALIQEGQRTTYSAIVGDAVHISAAIAALHPGPNALVAVLLPKSKDLFASMLGILRAGCAFLFITTEQPARRVEDILAHSGAAAVISTRETLSRIGLESISIPVIDCTELDPSSEAVIDPVRVEPDALAYVVYTSGSTGVPKGVEVTRRGLMNFTLAMMPVFGHGGVLSTCSVGFDAFIIESIVSLLNAKSIILPRADELESPGDLAKLMMRFSVRVCAFTPSRLAAFMSNADFALALGHMETIICGGEAFPSDLLQNLLRCTSANIYNQYGPSEATVGVSLKRLNDSHDITVGMPMQNCRLYILDEWMNPLPVGVYGNLYIGGICLARGYRNAAELTAERFLPNPFEMSDRIYRTGDIARWTPSGEVQLAGRADNQIKLRGLRIELQEISACLLSHPMVSDAIVRLHQENAQQALVAYYTAEPEVTEVELLAFASSFLPHYMLPSAIIRLDAFPLTPNGKVDDKKLPSPELFSQRFEAPVTPRQRMLLAIIQKVLGNTDIGISHDYFRCGGNSLNAMETLGKIAEKTGVTLRVSELYVCRSVRRLAELIDGRAGVLPESHALAPAPLADRYSLSPIQQGMYVQSMLDPEGMAYHMAGAFRLGFVPDVQRLQAAFAQLLANDRILRSYFVSEDGGIYARVASHCGFTLPVLHADTFADARTAFTKPFDLSSAPLLRAALWQDASGEWLLFLDMHHIIGDGLSTPVLLRRLDEAYRGVAVPENRLDFFDYLYHSARQKAQDTTSLEYWRESLSPLAEPLNLPGDFPRPHTFDYRGDAHDFALEPFTATEIDTACAKAGVTPFVLFSAAYGLLLSRLSAKEKLMIGIPVADRSLPETRDMCGPLLNTLPLCLVPEPQMTASCYLQNTHARMMGILDHQSISQEEIISTLKLPRSLGENPLYQVMFSLRPIDVDDLTLNGYPLQAAPAPAGTVKADLVMEAAREKNQYIFHLEYATSLFLPETAAYYGRCFAQAVLELLKNPDTALEALDILSPEDRRQLIDLPAQAVIPFDLTPLHRRIQMHAEADPEATALVFHGEAVSRGKLEARACALANLLASAGAVPGASIGIAMGRGIDMLASMLAALKTGGAYVPLLATLPEVRLRYMLETAQIRFILCDRETLPLLPQVPGVVCVPTDTPACEDFAAVPVQDSDLINILFTSGSTGKPKGVMLTHRGAANMQATMMDYLTLAEGPILCSTNIIFDAFVGETLCPLSLGKPVILADEEEMMLPWRMANLIASHGVTTVQYTPARLQVCLTNEAFARALSGVRVIWFGGEVLTPALLHSVCQVTNAITINMYGPTECTVYMTATQVFDGQRITIGRPIKNGYIHVLDEHMRPVLPTACGELYLGGECLAAGYISRPDLTETAFIPSPFAPGERLYRTGDIGRLRLDGCYDFMGRRDAQVKLNGQRVELDEISGAMMDTGFAVQAATIPIRNEDGSMQLAMFYIPSQGEAPHSLIVEKLRTVLPVYMVPSQIIPLEQMPYTPSAKIDAQALLKLARQQKEEAVSPRGETASLPDATPLPEPEAAPITQTPTSAEELLAVWRECFKSGSPLEPGLSFFDQGGTSLAALSVLSRYHNLGLVMSLKEFYDHPSARAQAALLGLQQPPQPVFNAATDANTSQYALPAKTPPANPASPMETVLLTGVTGFLGIHVFRSLLNAGVKTVICLTRDGNSQRLEDTFAWYFSEGWGLAAPCAEVLQGDITQPLLSLAPRDYARLAARIDAIWHCAADVRHYVKDRDAIFAANLGGTENIIALAKDAGADLHHMSTASVAGDRLTDSDATAVFSEGDFNIGQNWHENVYIHSKFLAEAAVFNAASQGLPARVYRLGRLVGRSQDGVFQKNHETNAFWLTLRAVRVLGLLPASLASTPVEMTPIDDCADMVVALRNAPITALHPLSPQSFTMEEAVRAIAPSVTIVSDDEFERQLFLRLESDSNGVLIPLADYWRRFLSMPPRIAVTCQKTYMALAQAGFTSPTSTPQRFLSSFQFEPNP